MFSLHHLLYDIHVYVSKSATTEFVASLYLIARNNRMEQSVLCVVCDHLTCCISLQYSTVPSVVSAHARKTSKAVCPRGGGWGRIIPEIKERPTNSRTEKKTRKKMTLGTSSGTDAAVRVGKRFITPPSNVSFTGVNVYLFLSIALQRSPPPPPP